MKIVVTGGSGLVGRYLIKDLVNANHQVLNVDRIQPTKAIDSFRMADLEDLGQVYGCLSGAEAVVHLAALHLHMGAGELVFRSNVMSTFNILEASASLGIPRVVMASSMSVLGFPGNYEPFAPRYAPVDEEHPMRPEDPYALSKVLNEESARAFVRRKGNVLTGSLYHDRPGYPPDAFERKKAMTVVCLRPTWIVTPESFKRQVDVMWDGPAAGAPLLWSYVDVRDVAQACRRAMEAEVTGFEAFIVAAPDSFMKAPTEELMGRFYPEAEIRSGLSGRKSVLTTEKAARMLGFQAEHAWGSY